MPRVSVIVPCYNYGRYLDQAVDSLLCQSFEDWEAIVIDDASTDCTPQVMQRFRDPRLTYVRHEQNRGNIATYNEGIQRAHGDFVAILSADDRYRPEFFKRAVEMLDRHAGIGMVYTAWQIIDTHSKRRWIAPRAAHPQDGIYDELPALLLGCHIPQCGTLVRRDVLREVGSYNPTLVRAGDWDLWLRVAKHGKVGFCRDPLYQYRRHGANMSLDDDTARRTEMELRRILDGAFSDPSLPPSLRALKPRAHARQDWAVAQLRFKRRDWRGGMAAVRKAIAGDSTLLVSPRRVAGLVLAAAYGWTGRSWLDL